MSAHRKPRRDPYGSVCITVKGLVSAACAILAVAGLADVFVISTAGFSGLRGPHLSSAPGESIRQPRLQLRKAFWEDEADDFVRIAPAEKIITSNNFDVGAIQALVQQEMKGKVQDLSAMTGVGRFQAMKDVRAVLQLLQALDEEGSLAPEHYADAVITMSFKRWSFDAFFMNDPDFYRFIENARDAIPEARLDSYTRFLLLYCLKGLQSTAAEFLELGPVICKKFPDDISGLHWKNITQALDAVANLKEDVPAAKKLLPTLLQGLLDNADKLDTTAIAITMKALGSLGLKRSDVELLLSAILKTIDESRIHTFSTQNLADFVWGLAQLNVNDDERLMATIVDIAEDRLYEITNPQNEVRSYPLLACSLKRMGFLDMQFLEALAGPMSKKHVLRHKLDDWSIAALRWCLPKKVTGADPLPVREFKVELDAALKKRKIDPQRVVYAPFGSRYWYRQEAEKATKQGRQRQEATAQAMRRREEEEDN